MTDDAEESAETLNVTHGLLIQVDGTWHHSEEFDGETYHTACGQTVEEPWTVRRPPATPDGGVCGDCFPQPGSTGDDRSTDGGRQIATDGGSAVRLYYTTGNSRSGGDRKLHPDDSCDHLDAAKNVKGCPASNAPRGQTCKDCSPPGLGGLQPSKYARRLAEREQPVPDGGPNGGDRQ